MRVAKPRNSGSVPGRCRIPTRSPKFREGVFAVQSGRSKNRISASSATGISPSYHSGRKLRSPPSIGPRASRIARSSAPHSASDRSSHLPPSSLSRSAAGQRPSRTATPSGDLGLVASAMAHARRTAESVARLHSSPAVMLIFAPASLGLRPTSREQPVQRRPHRRDGHDVHSDVQLHVVRVLPWAWRSQEPERFNAHLGDQRVIV